VEGHHGRHAVLAATLPVEHFAASPTAPIISLAPMAQAKSSDMGVPNIAEHRSSVEANCRASSTIDTRPTTKRFDARHRQGCDDDVTQSIGKPHIRLNGGSAASAFVNWAVRHGLAREWRVDEIWYLASEDFAPAHDLILPPQRVFLGALKRQPGVIVTRDRRIYMRSGKLIGKRSFYQLPTQSLGPAETELARRNGVTHAV
jgi:hypothetical protein